MKWSDFKTSILGIDRTAADWLARQGRGLSPAEETELSEWLRTDIRHARAYAELEATWKALDRLRDTRLSDGRMIMGETPPVALTTGNRRAALVKAGLGLAAALAMAYFGWWRPRLADAPFALTALTEVGDYKQLTLPDGSALELNTDTLAEVSYTPETRRVRLLRGEARFSVAKNPVRPFVVEAGGVAVRAVGTAFNVRLRPQAIEVLVTEGRVRVDDATSGTSLLTPLTSVEEPLLAAGERAVIAITPGTALPVVVQPVSPVEIERTLAWQEQRLVFDTSTLADVVAEFNRYSHHKLVLADPRLRDRHFGGAFSVANREAFVRLLESRFGIIAERRDRETLLRLADRETSP